MRKIFYLAMAAVIAIFTGCANDDDALLHDDSLLDDSQQDTSINVIPYVTFTATSEQAFTFTIPDEFTSALGVNGYFEYSVGDGEWKRFTTTVDNILFGGFWGSLRLRGKSRMGTALYSGDGCSTIQFSTANSPVDCTGDIRTLIDYENYADVSTAYAGFRYLFYQNKALRTAPQLPAKTLADLCYTGMFSGCTALTTAPELPAETLAYGCYKGMFSGCTSLTTAPELPAKTLANYCYSGMFSGCDSLTTAPELPAKTLADGCYDRMFFRCTSLTTAPELPAKTLAEYCYQLMFRGCTSLSSVTMLATNVRESKCLAFWLYEAGTNVQGKYPTLTLYNSDAYKKIMELQNNGWNYLPDLWRNNIRYKY